MKQGTCIQLVSRHDVGQSKQAHRNQDRPMKRRVLLVISHISHQDGQGTDRQFIEDQQLAVGWEEGRKEFHDQEQEEDARRTQ